MPNAAVIEISAKRSGGRTPQNRWADIPWAETSSRNVDRGNGTAPREIAKVIGATEDDARRIVGRLCSRPAYGARAERKRVGTETHYRIFKQDKTVSVEELTTKLRPIVEGLKAEGKKNMATMVPAEVAMLAARLERLLNEWAE